MEGTFATRNAVMRASVADANRLSITKWRLTASREKEVCRQDDLHKPPLVSNYKQTNTTNRIISLFR